MSTSSANDLRWLNRAIELSRHCPPAELFRVGAVLVDATGRELACGYSRQHDPHDHAEEVTLAGWHLGDHRLSGATLYSSLEPCSTRASRPTSCTELIVNCGIGRVVFALREPPMFVDCKGAELMAAAGVEVNELPELAPLVRRINSHLIE